VVPQLLGELLPLVGGLEHEVYFPYIGNNDPNSLIFFRGVGIPPTSYGGEEKTLCGFCCKPRNRTKASTLMHSDSYGSTSGLWRHGAFS